MPHDDNDTLPDDVTVAHIINPRGANVDIDDEANRFAICKSQHALPECNVYSRFLLARARWEDGRDPRAAQEGPL